MRLLALADDSSIPIWYGRLSTHDDAEEAFLSVPARQLFLGMNPWQAVFFGGVRASFEIGGTVLRYLRMVPKGIKESNAD